MDTTDPILLLRKGNTTRDPLDKTGTSGRTMRPGEEVMDDGNHNDGFVLQDGRRGMGQKGADGKLQFFLVQGKGKVLAPDGIYKAKNGLQFTVSGGFVTSHMQAPSAGQTQAPSQLQIPGKMR